MASDPFVHYTVNDLYAPLTSHQLMPVPVNNGTALGVLLTNWTGMTTTRYCPWNVPGSPAAAPPMGNGNDLYFTDPLITSANDWAFPSNAFPSVGWLGRVHRGTPWQTVSLKADDPNGPTSYANWFTKWVSSPFTYPTNDWALVDLFTAVPNDNAARGLLSVNQANDSAWAAAFAGAIVLTNNSGGVALNPTNDVANLVDAANGINATRSNNVNGLFHHVGEILRAPALTTQSPYVTAFENLSGQPSDEMLERIPQQTLGLMKVGLPQFVIYSWGQALKPKNLYQAAPYTGLCTNYEITGEFLSRTVCHVVSDPAAGSPKIVVDSYNIEPSN